MQVFTSTSQTFRGACFQIFELYFGTAIENVLNWFLKTSHNSFLDKVT